MLAVQHRLGISVRILKHPKLEDVDPDETMAYSGIGRMQYLFSWRKLIPTGHLSALRTILERWG